MSFGLGQLALGLTGFREPFLQTQVPGESTHGLLRQAPSLFDSPDAAEGMNLAAEDDSVPAIRF